MSNDLLHSNHQNWLSNPVTQASKKVIQEHLDKLVNFVADNANNKDVTSEQIRCYAAQIRVLKQNIEKLYDTEQFIKTITEQQSK